ncbi:hypothetical protein LINGRAHAP2_LOCUS10418 [Linum grandiflorum]
MAAGPLLFRQVISLDAAIYLFLHKIFHHPFRRRSSSSRFLWTSDSHFPSPSSFFSPLSPRRSSLSSPLSSSASSSISVSGLTKSIFRRARPSYNHSSISVVVANHHYSFV